MFYGIIRYSHNISNGLPHHTEHLRGISSTGRAPALQAGG